MDGHVLDSVKSLLLDGEEVLSTVTMGGRLRATVYYATNKRLIRIRTRQFPTSIASELAEVHERAKRIPGFQALNYSKMSISFKRYGIGTNILHIIAVIFGLFSISLGVFGFIGPTFITETTILRTKAPLEVSILLWGIGIFVMLIAFAGRYAYYQIESPHLEKEDLKNWRIDRPRWGASRIEAFARVIEERMAER